MAVSPSKFKQRAHQRGLATVEAIPLLVIFVMLVGYAMGLFGAIHTGILQSIAARTYAFETFRNRANVKIFRENTRPDLANLYSYSKKGMRYHTVRSEEGNADDARGFFVTRRPLAVGYPSPNLGNNKADHSEKIFTIQPRNQTVGVGPIWVMVGYGLCIDAKCGSP